LGISSKASICPAGPSIINASLRATALLTRYPPEIIKLPYCKDLPATRHLLNAAGCHIMDPVCKEKS
jgi:hypothetical protein